MKNKPITAFVVPAMPPQVAKGDVLDVEIRAHGGPYGPNERTVLKGTGKVVSAHPHRVCIQAFGLNYVVPRRLAKEPYTTRKAFGGQ